MDMDTRIVELEKVIERYKIEADALNAKKIKDYDDIRQLRTLSATIANLTKQFEQLKKQSAEQAQTKLF